MDVLVVVAVEAERVAVLDALQPSGAAVRVIVGGVGPAAAAAATSAELAGRPAELVFSAGLAGGFVPLGSGDVAVASAVVFADLGAQSPAGFLPLSALGLGDERHEIPAKLAVELADRTGGHLGTILTVATVTGTAERATELAQRFPDAVAEAMEGAGVAAAAARHDVPFAEIRAVSNAVGPRDRAAWQIPAALDALGRAIAAAVALQ